MHFSTLVLAGLAITGASASPVTKKASATTTSKHSSTKKGPAVVSNTAAAVKDVLAQMSAKKPKTLTDTKPHTKTVTGSAFSTTNLAKTKKVKAAATTKHARRDAAPATITVNVPGAVSSLIGNFGSAVSVVASKVSSVAASVATAACAAEVVSPYKVVPAVDSMLGFLQTTDFYTTSLNATTPSGYNWLYGGFFASLNQDGYQFYTQHDTYDPSLCSAICDANSACYGFNIVYERTPVITPALACPNPTSQTTIKCAYYSQALQVSAATNIGQWRANFGVVISGGNGYQKVTPPVATTTTSAAAVATATSAAAAATTTAATVVNNFRIISAYYADSNITSFAQSNFVSGSQLVINTTAVSTSSAITDPWTSNKQKTISILYTYKDETRVFTGLAGSGAYVQQDAAFSTSTAPGCSLTPSGAASLSAKSGIVSVVYGTVMSSSTSLFSTLLTLSSTGLPFTVGSAFFGFDGLSGASKTCVIWYLKNGVLTALTGRDGSSITF